MKVRRSSTGTRFAPHDFPACPETKAPMEATAFSVEDS